MTGKIPRMPVDSLTVMPVSVPGQQEYEDSIFPFVLECQTPDAVLDEVTDWVTHRQAELLAQAKEHGAILFRNFPLESPEDFDVFLSAFGLPNFPYGESFSNAVRISFTERVFSANEAPPEVAIYLHHELAQTPIFPSRIFFFCREAATTGGETPLCRSDVLWERLSQRSPEFTRACEEKGLQYTNVMPSEDDAESGMGRSWQSTFSAGSSGDAESQMRNLNYSWKWLPDGCLRATTPILPAVREVAPGRKTFFNQLIAASHWKDKRNDPLQAIRFGDGTPLDAGAVQLASELADELTFDLPWQSGDVVLVDNRVTMHGRRNFSGTRRVLASLAAAQTHENGRRLVR